MEELTPVDNLRRKIVLYKKDFGGYVIKVKPLCLTRDIRPIHQWVNMEYTKTFWQMDWPYAKIYHHYRCFINSGLGYSLMFFIDDIKRPVALMDCYLAHADEVGKLYEVAPEDFGVHMLMAPQKNKISRLSTNVMITGLSFLFSLGVERIIGEPDARNSSANELVKRVGFRFVKEIEMSYKKANLYFCDKKDFLKEHPQ